MANPQVSRLDYLQVKMFQLLYKLRLPDVGPDMAFASAIADTSDDKMAEVFEKRPELVEQWVEKYSRKRANKKYDSGGVRTSENAKSPSNYLKKSSSSETPPDVIIGKIMKDKRKPKPC